MPQTTTDFVQSLCTIFVSLMFSRGGCPEFLKVVTAPNGAVTTMQYSNGNRTSTTTPVGISRTTEFDTAGRPKKTFDVNNRLSTMEYDAAGRLKKTNTQNRITQNDYYPDGRLKKVTNPDNSFEAYTYDPQGNRKTTTDQDGNVTAFTYESNGNVKSQTVKDNNGDVVLSQTSDYNTMNQLKEVTDGLGNSTRFTNFDAMGNPEKTFDAKDNLTKKTYDLQNRLKIVQDAKGKLTKYDYDNNGNLDKVTAPNGAITTMEYDALNQLENEISPDRGTTLYEDYDASGNVQKITDDNGNIKNIEYDSVNRKKTEKWQGSPQLDIAYVYDSCSNGKGKLCSVTDASGSTTFEYNYQGNLVKKVQNIGTTSLVHKFFYTGENKLWKQNYPSGQSVVYRYGADKLIGININGTQFIKEITYDAAGQIEKWKWHNGLAYNKSYEDGRLKTFTLGNDTRTLAYDPVGNLNLWEDENTQGNNLPTYKKFGYNTLNRLENFDEYKRIQGANDQRLQHQGFGYDTNGNRTSLAEQGKPYTVYTHKNLSNQLKTIKLGGNTRTLIHDDNGNLTSDGLHSYSYDARNRMTGVDNSTVFTYNAMNQRVRKSGPNGTTLYAWANDRIIGEYTTNGSAKNETLYLGNTPVGIIKSGTRYRVYADQIDTPRLITTQGNTAVWRWVTQPFGESQPNQDVDGNGSNFDYNLRFPGQYYDQETKTHYNYRRDYNPKTGRYTQSDPIGISGGIGTYSYVSNSPLMGRDPRGENPFLLFAAAAVITAPLTIPVISNAITDTFEALQNSGVFGSSAINDGSVVLREASEVVDELNQIGNDSRAVPYPEKNSGKWTAICRVDDQSVFGLTANGKSFAFGWGIASDMVTARRDAEQMAKDILGSSNVHHPSCKCHGPKGERNSCGR